MLLRATDVLFRKLTLGKFTPLELITLEHIVACIVLLPFFPKLKLLRNLGPSGIFYLILVACGASVGGILCFTTAFQYINPAIVILLQKLQPVVTVFLSVLILREKIDRSFYFWAAIAVGAGYLLSFGFSTPVLSWDVLATRGTVFALGATLLWGGGTVFGKSLLSKMDNNSLTKFRYYIGMLFAVSLLLINRNPSELAIFQHYKVAWPIVYMALVPGLLALLLFYKGLKSTSASVASICELFFPVASVAIVWIGFGQKLNHIQIGAAAILIISILMISRLNRRKNS